MEIINQKIDTIILGLGINKLNKETIPKNMPRIIKIKLFIIIHFHQIEYNIK